MNNWQVGKGGPLQQDYLARQPNNGQMVVLPDGRLGSLADLVKYYSGGEDKGFHPTDLQAMVRQGG